MTAISIHRRWCGSCRDGSTWPRSLLSHWHMVTPELIRLRQLAAAVQQSRNTVRLVALRGGLE